MFICVHTYLLCVHKCGRCEQVHGLGGLEVTYRSTYAHTQIIV